MCLSWGNNHNLGGFIPHEVNEGYTIYCSTGDIYFDNDKDLDREDRNNEPYKLIAVATDHGEKPKTARANVFIYLIDVNDNAPQIISPNISSDAVILYLPSNNKQQPDQDSSSGNDTNPAKRSTQSPFSQIRIGNVQSSELTSPWSNPVVLTHVRAEDADEGENGRVRYRIVDGNIHNYFSIDDSTGNITMPLNGNKYGDIVKGCHVIKLSLKDHGLPEPMENSAWVSRLLYFFKRINYCVERRV